MRINNIYNTYYYLSLFNSAFSFMSQCYTLAYGPESALLNRLMFY